MTSPCLCYFSCSWGKNTWYPKLKEESFFGSQSVEVSAQSRMAWHRGIPEEKQSIAGRRKLKQQASSDKFSVPYIMSRLPAHRGWHPHSVWGTLNPSITVWITPYITSLILALYNLDPSRLQKASPWLCEALGELLDTSHSTLECSISNKNAPHLFEILQFVIYFHLYYFIWSSYVLRFSEKL